MIFIFFVSLASAPAVVSAAAPSPSSEPAPGASRDASYLDELKSVAADAELHKSRNWEVLLHYKPTIFGVESLVDDPKFFLSPVGKKDPRAELLATIDGFFTEGPLDDTHPQCRFIARYTWLKEALSIDASRLPAASCREFNDTLAKINPRSAVLVFSAAHINSPASMFGHTLVRIDSERESRLMSYAANYSALVDQNTQGLVYAFKGLFGYYKGFFTILPYYEKVKEYNDTDQRDMWEYRLNFSEEEVVRLIMHLWELQNIYTYYYFFDENCSYTLLFLLESARPSLRLTEQFELSAIPVDTIRAVKAGGAVGEVVYRPSMATRMRHLASLLESDGKDLASDIAHRRATPAEVLEMDMDESDRMTVLDLAAEHVQYRFTKKELTQEEYRKVFLETLKARGGLGKQNPGLYEIETPPSPEDGHLSRRFSAGGGLKDDMWFAELQYRPAYHKLLDPMEGYIEGSQIEFFETTLRYYPELKRVELERVNILNILSLTPRDRFFKPLSWKGLTGFTQRFFPDRDGDDRLVFRLNAGMGYVYKHPLGIYYGMVEGDLLVGSTLRDSYSLGAGVALGLTGDFTGRWKTHLYAKAFFYELGEVHRSYEATLKQSFKITSNNTVSLDLTRERIYGIYRTRGKLAWNIFF